ncbi:restriction endonuclease subunit S [Escherichia coli]|uniref:restriction endonuclease subunit S n=1 Tax=Escherichia coli TaxID=562 RepID=UPI00296A96FE|nr:restriction endonuclease subunit S [Escherichia coli]
MGEISVKTGNNARNGGKNSLNRLIRCVCGKKIGPDPRNFNQRVSLGRNDLLIRTFLNLDEVKYFSLNDYKEDLSSFEVSMGNILIAMSGATTGKVGIYKKEIKCYLNQRVGKFIPKENILNNNYLYHFLLLNTETIYILAGGGAQPNLSSNALMSKLLIPIPCPGNPEKSLAIQSEIVRILDKFDTLTNSITEGLPREIELRQKQYEYYRDLLFSFPKPETVSK